MIADFGIFGGTFDPFHNGHLALVNSFLDSNQISKLLIIPVLIPPHKTIQQITPIEIRLEMIRAVYENSSRIIISDIEATLPIPNYSYITLKKLQELNSNSTFRFCIGSDSLNDFKDWYNSSEILKESGLLVAVRNGVVLKNVPKWILDQTVFVKHNPIDVSSSKIREDINKTGHLSDVPPQVFEIIHKYHLYR